MKNLFFVALMAVAGCVGSDKSGVDVGSAEVVSSAAPAADSVAVPEASATASLDVVESAAPVSSASASAAPTATVSAAPVK